MDSFWVGIRGKITNEQASVLETEGLPVEAELREIVARYGTGEWETLRTFVRTPEPDAEEAIERVARVLALEPADLVAFSAGTFR